MSGRWYIAPFWKRAVIFCAPWCSAYGFDTKFFFNNMRPGHSKSREHTPWLFNKMVLFGGICPFWEDLCRAGCVYMSMNFSLYESGRVNSDMRHCCLLAKTSYLCRKSACLRGDDRACWAAVQAMSRRVLTTPQKVPVYTPKVPVMVPFIWKIALLDLMALIFN